MRKFLIAILLCLSLGSCATQRSVETVSVNHYDTVYCTNYAHDSIYISQEITRLSDTVYIDRFEYRYRQVHDTIYRSSINDSVRVETQTVEVEKATRSPFLIGCTVAFWVLLVCLIAYIIIRIILKIRS